MPYKRMYLRALDLYVAMNIDFVDALSVAQTERAKVTTILSFDRDFDRVPGITRQGP
jgi:predicted nucleic acid-binding protein